LHGHKKRPRTVLCWAEAFKVWEEEKNHLERVLNMRQLGTAQIDNYQEDCFAGSINAGTCSF
jgi:hypothetical protein